MDECITVTKNSVTITKIVCVRLQHGSDSVFLHTNLPQATWPFDGTACLKLDVSRGKAEQYVAEHFPGVPFELIES